MLTTMRSSEAIPQSFVRPKLNQRQHMQIQPLWMRVLEEKYQKLQLKIAQSTATMNGLYNSTIGRSIYDTKLVRSSLQRTKEQRRSGKYELKSTRISATQIYTGGETKHKTSNIYSEFNERSNSDDEYVNTFDKGTKINDSGVRVSEILCLRYDKNQPFRKDLSKILKPQEKSHNYMGNYSNVDNSSNNVKNADMPSSSIKTAEYSPSRRSLSTLKTSKSCPVNLMDNCVQTKFRAESAGRTKINRRKMKMFSRMSAEAQTALTETIMENESEGNLDSEDEANTTIEDNIFQTDGVLSIEDRTDCNDSEISMPSRDSRSIHTKLPEIPTENPDILSLRHIKSTDVKVGKYPFPSKRETTFEITPPGFDIRYRDAPIREERESETPPPDIRDRAIRKCEDWLTRYTPRTPRPSQTSQ